VRHVREGSGAGVIGRFNTAAVRLTIYGAVQGVGFHPFAYALARARGLSSLHYGQEALELFLGGEVDHTL
jgi:Acylphosphatase